jgi:Alpha-2-macroglobulin family
MQTHSARVASCVLAGLLVTGCRSSDKSAPAEQTTSSSLAAKDEAMRGPGGGGAAAPASPAAAEPEAPARLEAKQEADQKNDNERRRVDDGFFAAKAGKGKAKQPEGLTRAWFPETFLFEPRVITDDKGEASFTAAVPDRLTTWRILALAHSRSGAQGGAVTSFLGTLPTYVDPVVPKTLVVGDQVRLPIQIVNTTSEAVSTSLRLDAENATISGAGGPVTVPANSNRVEYCTLSALRPGPISVRVILGDRDAVVRTIEVLPSGRPVSSTHTGTLAAPRTVEIDGVVGADPTSDHVRLLAFPGALALLRSELAVATSRTEVADDAYALLLAGRAPGLLTALGGQADPEAIRELSILTGQRAIRDARTLDTASASLLTEAALAHPNNPVLARLGARAADYLATNQRPDGTFSGGDGWTLQRALVATAEATRAVASATTTAADKKRATAVSVRAAGAFERNAIHVEDGYTAAAILASGAVTGKTAEQLRAIVRAAIKPAGESGKALVIAEGVVRADGTVPSALEGTALAVLALAGDPQAPLADLGATILGNYGFASGWGDGRTNLVAMRAVLELFKAPVPPDVSIQLWMDETQVAQGVLSKDKLHEVLVLEAPAPGLASAHTWRVVADPPVPGLGYSLTTQSWVPWDKSAVQHGLELQLSPVAGAAVGKPIAVAVNAIAPAGLPLHLRLALPAGVQPDRQSLQALVDATTISRFATADGSIDLYVAPLQPGQSFAAQLRVIPTLAGSLHTQASLIEAGPHQFYVPPTTWKVQ